MAAEQQQVRRHCLLIASECDGFQRSTKTHVIDQTLVEQGEMLKFRYPTCVWGPVVGDPVGIL